MAIFVVEGRSANFWLIDFGGLAISSSVLAIVAATVEFPLLGVSGFKLEDIVNLLDRLDALEASGAVCPFVFLSGGVITDLCALDVHGERRFGVIGSTASPINRSIVVLGISSGPNSKPNCAGCLRIVFALVRVSVHQSSDFQGVDIEVHLLCGPINGIVVEVIVDIGSRIVIYGSVERSGVSFAKVVGLRNEWKASHELPVNLVEILRLQNDRGNDTLTSRSPHDDGNRSEEYIELGLNSGGFLALGDSKFCAILTIRENAICDVEGVANGTGGIEVECMVSDAKGGILWGIWTGCFVHCAIEISG